jgi:putative holliday junction resolvase
MVDRTLCLDLGTRRIGVAISDPMGFSAQPLETIPWTSTQAVLQRLTYLRGLYQPVTVVVGLPLDPSGTPGAAARRIRRLLKAISPALEGCRVIEWDERYTSAAAERVLLEADLSRSDRKQAIDRVAASLILQGYLGSRSAL